MSASAVTDVTSATTQIETQGDALASKQRPEVAAVLLQRLEHALNAGGKACTEGSRCLPGDDAARDTQSRVPDKRSDAQRPMAFNASEDASTRETNERAFGALGHMVTRPAPEQVIHTTANQPAAQCALADELHGLLERLCSGVYVGDRSSSQQRVLLTLEGALHGAAAEIVRDGVRLIIRLHASNELALRTMLTQRQALEQALHEHELPQVSIEIIPLGGLVRARHE